LSEDWCGDSAQVLPYFAEIAKLNANIKLRILLRDKNLDIMDQYQTNRTRSIPKLVAFDLEGNELYQWGPRPKAAVELIAKLKGEGKTKEEFLEQLHLWYARNRGVEILNELLDLIKPTVKQLAVVPKRKT
ncbi:MAG: thioredoxin family protein, partial [Bacteroidota bacterium]